MTTKKKICPKCKVEKKLTEFGNRTYSTRKGVIKTTKLSYCKGCSVVRALEWREKNRERFLAYQRDYQNNKKEVA